MCVGTVYPGRPKKSTIEKGCWRNDAPAALLHAVLRNRDLPLKILFNLRLPDENATAALAESPSFGADSTDSIIILLLPSG